MRDVLRAMARGLAAGMALLASTPLWAEAQAETQAQVQAQAPGAVVDADPALWVIRDADTTIYLFGTVHLLKPGLGWFDEAVAEAFAASDELRLEIPDMEGDPKMAELMVGLARAEDGRTMRDRLGAQAHADYVARLASVGIVAEALEPFEPWFAMTIATVRDYLVQGYGPEHGAETLLLAAARAAGKPVSAFETAEEQLRILDSMPEAEQIAGLKEWVREGDAARESWTALVAAWAAGDPETAGALLNREMVKMPVSAKLLLEDRNRRWAAAIAKRMQEPGTLFVAVGAGHLMGDRSVQALLKEKGILAERLPY